MDEKFARAALLLGKDNIEKLSTKGVAIFGVGGVGSFSAEAIARSGIGKIMLVDPDTVDISNINRQLPATTKTLGRLKVDVLKERILDINPDAKVDIYTEDNFNLLLDGIDYIIDAVDTVTTKLNLTEFAYKNNIPIIGCMGAGNKLDPTQFEVADIFSTSVCPLCRVMRQALKKRGVDKLKVVYSQEQPITPDYSQLPEDEQAKMLTRADGGRRSTPGSLSFVPPVAGMIAAGEVIKDLIR